MNPKSFMKSAEELCCKGEGEALYKFLAIHRNDIDDKSCLRILVLCLNKCLKNEHVQNVSLEYIYKVLKLTVFGIKTLNMNDLKIYLQTMYHFTKEFADKVRKSVLTKINSIHKYILVYLYVYIYSKVIVVIKLSDILII